MLTHVTFGDQPLGFVDIHHTKGAKTGTIVKAGPTQDMIWRGTLADLSALKTGWLHVKIETAKGIHTWHRINYPVLHHSQRKK